MQIAAVDWELGVVCRGTQVPHYLWMRLGAFQKRNRKGSAGEQNTKAWRLAKPFSAQWTIQMCWGSRDMGVDQEKRNDCYGVMLTWGKFLTGGSCASETTYVSLLREGEGQGTPPRREKHTAAMVSVSQWCHSAAPWGVWVREVLRAAAACCLRAIDFVLSMASRCWGRICRECKAGRLNV